MSRREFSDPQRVERAKQTARKMFPSPLELRRDGLKPVLEDHKGRRRLLRELNARIALARTSRLSHEEIERLLAQRRTLEIQQFANRMAQEATLGRRVI